MADPKGFLTTARELPRRRPVDVRIEDWHEVYEPFAAQRTERQAARCMDCGIPFCHSGCPLGNLIPEWNDLVYRGDWADAADRLHATNNFPEFTGRLCPAPCEAACVLEIREGDAVSIKQIENAIVNRAWQEGWIKAERPRRESGRSVAVIGSGPAGLAAAQQLRRAGHRVVLYERDEAPGGLVRFGVPDFKIEKRIVQRRVEQLLAEGVELRCGVDVGGIAPGATVAGVEDLRGDRNPTDGDGSGAGAREVVSVEALRGAFDAIVLATGSRVPRDLPVPGRELDGVHFAMDYLYQRNRFVARIFGPPVENPPPTPAEAQVISANGRHVIVIGGGDTGADCVA